MTNKAGEQVALETILAQEIKEATVEKDVTAIEVSLPLDGHDGRTLTNLVNMIYSKQGLIKKALALTENMVEQELVDKLKENQPATIEEFLMLATSNVFTSEDITFTSTNTEPEEIKAFTDLVGLINGKAKELKYASPKPVDTDNEKYTFRAWIMRLGMLGPAYKMTRKVLLQHLSGNTAFRKVGKTMKPRCKLIGENGNIFNLMALASKALKEVGLENESKEMISQVMDSKDYFEAIAVISQYVEIE